jgi:hypothetical protein
VVRLSRDSQRVVWGADGVAALTGARRRLSVSTLAGLPPELRLRLPDGTSVPVARDLRARLHPNAEFMEAILTGKRQQIRAPADS